MDKSKDKNRNDKESNGKNEISESKSTDDQVEYPFNFPFKPYDIQVQLMEVAYDVYKHRKFALLESPTGTGKSLSLMCSALTWLRDYQNKVKSDLETNIEELNYKIEIFKKDEEVSGDWLSVQSKRQDINRELDNVNRKLDRILKFEAKDQARWHAKMHGKSFDDYDALVRLSDNFNGKKRESGLLISNKDKNNVDLDMSRTFCAQSSQESSSSFKPDIKNETKNNIGEDNDNDDDNGGEDDLEKKINRQLDEEDHIKPKIYFSSRTHSQLSQFIGELKRTKFADPLKAPPIKLAPMASRANLCVNPEVTKFKDSSAINERCIEMQRETNKDKRCPYIKGKQVSLLKEEILSSVQDIEDIVAQGKIMGSCPYYASRMAVPESEVVVLPYNNLFHHDTRKASSLNLKDSVVIVDEAHNILETICSIHSAQINGQQLISAHTILSRYFLKFHNRFSPKNAEMIKTIIYCLTSLIRYLNEPKKHIAEFENPKVMNVNELLKTPNESKVDSIVKPKNTSQETAIKPVRQEEIMIDVMKFICASNIERFNVFKVIDYFERSQLARKLIGFFRQDSSYDLNLDITSANGNEITNNGNQTKNKKEDKKNKSRRNQQQGPNKRRKVIDKNNKQASILKIGEQEMSTPQKNSTTGSENYKDRTNLQFLIESNPNLTITKTSTQTNLQQKVSNGLKDLAYPIYTLVEFLKSLTTNLVKDGKICTEYFEGNIQQSQLKFILLNPSSQFKQMTEESRSIVLAGGTMQPFNEFIDLLFKPLGIDEIRLKLFSCGHVISAKQLYVSTLYHGSSGKPLELSYKTKASFEFIDEIGRTLLNLTNVVPGGMVCFLPSYDYEMICFKRWSQLRIINQIEFKSKQVFREPRQANQLKLIWEEYSNAIEKGKSRGRGALLFCVVGGKMSEGINFNDDLGRCIVMIGLPYANIKSGELQQKMSYYDKSCSRTMSSSSSSVAIQKPVASSSFGSSLSAGQQYYENLCIKGINQSIGRAVRHQNDYASIILLDRRYSSKTSIRNGLPEWLRKSLVDNERFGPLLAQVKSFFTQMTSN